MSRKKRKNKRRGLVLVSDKTRERSVTVVHRDISDIKIDIDRQRVLLRQSRLRYNYETKEMNSLYEELDDAKKAAIKENP